MEFCRSIYRYFVPEKVVPDKKEPLPEMCLLCHDEMKQKNIFRPECGHPFHNTCIKSWILETRLEICPYCNQELGFLSYLLQTWCLKCKINKTWDLFCVDCEKKLLKIIKDMKEYHEDPKTEEEFIKEIDKLQNGFK
ncbi:hypothetical protein AVEN_249573-1 [Araneus ventricosus]|uniref:RING-type domain-containing protein n=1 Tax=Araneus ventricosus TaxID=182803 RepID=A0A4Y2BA29_ARAVE|nr:hypothetical protein AVEN_249573-1 [Araneus ventricosus]